jgi:hypothetical protein
MAAARDFDAVAWNQPVKMPAVVAGCRHFFQMITGY